MPAFSLRAKLKRSVARGTSEFDLAFLLCENSRQPSMKLFLSHASEDKDFVRPLADRLDAEGFTVWLDERSMTLGDSLLGKINEGLLGSDYGVVVLSPTFFGKKWTRAELGALMALETTTKKMILPIWKGLSAETIKDLMPTLADRVAVDAAQGLDVVVQAIKSAVGAARHQQTLSQFDQLKTRLDRMSAEARARRTADLLLNSAEGAKRIAAEFVRLGELLHTHFAALSSEEMKFEVRKGAVETFTVQGPKRYGVEIHFTDGAFNSGANASLPCVFYRLGELQALRGRADPQILTRLTYHPYFDATGAVVWSPHEKREEMMSTETLVMFFAEKLTDYVASARR